MLLLLQSAPLLLLLVLLIGLRAGPLLACLGALAAAIPAVLLTLPGGAPAAPGFLGAEALRALYLGLQPVAVLSGGLIFHTAVTRLAPPGAVAAPATPRRIFAATLLGGVFVEGVTGFSVGVVFALAALRRMGLSGAPAGALSMLALTLVPWGGLGPGTALGAALAHLPAQQLAIATSWLHAAWMPVLAMVCWRITTAAGIAVPWRERLAQLAMMSVMAGQLLLGNRILPFETVGLFTTGPMLLWVLWRLDPPRDAVAWRRALSALAPWAGLAAALLLARSWSGAPAFRPYADLPAFPLTHVSVVLWCVALLLLACGPRRPPGLSDGRLAALGAALRRARRPALAILLYVLLGRWLAGSGIAASLAESASGALGPLAAYAMPPLGLASGMVTGTNVGSNAALMPVQLGLGQAAGLRPDFAAALHNFSGAAGAGAAFAGAAMVCGLLGDGTRPVQLWRLLAPGLAAVVLIGWAALLIVGA